MSLNARRHDLDAVARSWALGDLTYLMHEVQVAARDWVWSRPERVIVICCSRRLGKTILAAGLVNEAAMRVPTLAGRPAKIRIASATAVDVREFFEPAMQLYRGTEVPAWARHAFKEHIGRFEWANGSRAQIAGVNGGQEDRLRGRECDLFIVEEASTIDRLRYLVQSVAMPQVLTTGGKVILIFTPPQSPDHESVQYLTEAEARGTLFLRTIYDAPHVTQEQIEQIAADCGGVESTTFRREFLCEVVTDETRAIIPEFQREEPHIVQEHERPEYYVPIVAMDLGYHDLTVAVCGYYDFKADLDVITHEAVFQHSTSAEINAGVAEIELEAFGPGVTPRRYVDAPPIVVADLRRLRGWTASDEASGKAAPWSEVRKDDVDASINALRVRVRRRRVRIHPRCKTVIAHMRHGIWNKARTSFARSDEHGHYDGIDACRYFERHVDRHTDPYPLIDPNARRETHRIPTITKTNPQARKLAAALRGRR